jgi:hypothetical protein
MQASENTIFETIHQVSSCGTQAEVENLDYLFFNFPMSQQLPQWRKMVV